MSGAAKRMKLLLPIKTSQGHLIMQSREEEAEDQRAMMSDHEDAAGSDASGNDEVSEYDIDANLNEVDIQSGDDNEGEAKQLSAVEQMALEEACVTEMKINIANHAQSVMDNPQENVGHLRKLRLLLANPLCKSRPVLADYIVVSLCEVFKDVLPSYKIRLATDAEKGQQAKRETKRLRAFEETLLLNYRKYLTLLRQAMRKQALNNATGASNRGKELKISGWRRKRKRLAEKDEAQLAYSNRTVAVRCLSQLLAAHPNFNESSELIAWLTPCLNSRSSVISAIACSAFRQLFVEDRAGEASLRAVKSVCRVAIAAGAKVHADLLDVLASVRLDLPPPSKDSNKDKQLTHRQKLASLSRRQRRQDKRSADVTRGLEELRHQESVAVRARLQQRCAELLLHLYLKVLRARPSARALTAALTGLGRLALRVNLDLLPDLFSALGGLLDWPDLSAAHSVEVVSAALALLSGEGESLTLDPRQFYLHLYKRLNRLVRQHPELAERLSQILLTALSGRRRHLPPMRPVNFLRRLTDSICQAAAAAVAGGSQMESGLACLLGCAARLFAVFPRAHRLLEPNEEFDDDMGPSHGQLAIVIDNNDPDLGGGLSSCQSCEPAIRRLANDSRTSGLLRRLAGQLLKQNFSAVIAATGGSETDGGFVNHRQTVDKDDSGDDDDGDDDNEVEQPSRQSGPRRQNRPKQHQKKHQQQQRNFGKQKPGARKFGGGGGGKRKQRNRR